MSISQWVALRIRRPPIVRDPQGAKRYSSAKRVSGIPMEAVSMTLSRWTAPLL